MTTNEQEWLVDRFEAQRAQLRSVAYRMLGSRSEADDAVQETWLRLSRTETGDVENLGGWLTTVVARVCLDMLRTRKSRREAPYGDEPPERIVGAERPIDPEHEAVLADSVGPALLVVLDTLAPNERLAFVLHDLFGVPFDEIATIVGRSPEATRQLASRARRRVRGASASTEDVDRTRQREIVDAFLAASRGGDFVRLVRLLDPEVVMRSDSVATQLGSIAEARGATAVAEQFAGRARAAQVALLDDLAGLIWAQGGQVRVAFQFTIADGRITRIDVVADAERIAALQPSIL